MNDFLTDGDRYILETVEVPQANDLFKVFHVASLVADGARTAEEISAGLGIVEREGAYHASAACAIRVVRKRETSEGTQYELTEMGETYVEADDDRRPGVVVRRTLDCPHLKFVAHQLRLEVPIPCPVPAALRDEVLVTEALRAFPDLSPNTRARRAASLVSWVRKVDALAS